MGLIRLLQDPQGSYKALKVLIRFLQDSYGPYKALTRHLGAYKALGGLIRLL